MWYDPWFGSPAYGGGYYGYPNSDVYGYTDSGSSYQDDDSAPPPQQGDQPGNNEQPNSNWITPNGPSPSSVQNSANPVRIYMRSGAVYTVSDYWITDGELHYILMDGARNIVDLDQVDLMRTNEENAKSGVKFIFKSEPSGAAPEPDGNAAPPVPQP
jgi:hypothetical protein